MEVELNGNDASEDLNLLMVRIWDYYLEKGGQEGTNIADEMKTLKDNFISKYSLGE